MSEIFLHRGEKIIVPLSNISGLLEDNKLGKDMTLSRSIALAENIYQSERRQLERSLHEDALYSGELLQNKPIFEKIMSRDKHSFSLDKSTKSAVTRSEEDEKSTISQLDHICNAGIECDDDADSLTSRMWSIFVNASRAFNGYGHQISFHERSGIAYKHSDDWINYQGKEENYVVTPREALEIVEGAIQRLNQNNW
ncbi:hypothetical protein BEWA_034560 [Theileria equi strain WA]|uniref:Uncharacterized protein n=1 Tax=Theileria equi strain WA TaxID=1537102 RepID=L0AZA8_THEEQ|nr:hypothetical protein BEWA_034560 [Theileria equi strain WA]AFZ80598.1 hypothetical protein BEWA_034560 [Theileria equi strain WA]|eukprot:XP_004830264.1 hypothetical protein BEWA_034560 [Theileria equi strain WA]